MGRALPSRMFFSFLFLLFLGGDVGSLLFLLSGGFWRKEICDTSL